MSGAAAAPPRPRRRRALASGLRLTLAQDAVADSAALEERLRGIAASQGTLLPPEADLPEMLARLEPGGGLPPELPALLATLLLPLFRPDPAEPRTRPESPLRSAPR
ncbi:MAG TPA: hypothetical protein VNR89_24055 [Roseomonas sp.]|nr:hypothetical protein [Roseomonas sp.]